MVVAVVVIVGFLLALGLVLLIVDRRRPAFFRCKATLTKWVSLDLEMHSPEDGHKGAAPRPSIKNKQQ